MTFFTRCSICRCLIEKDTYVFYCIRIRILVLVLVLVLVRLSFYISTSSHFKQPSLSSFPTIFRNYSTRSLYFHSFVNIFFFCLFPSLLFFFLQRSYSLPMCSSRHFTFYFRYVCDMNLKIGNEIGEF